MKLFRANNWANTDARSVDSRGPKKSKIGSRVPVRVRTGSLLASFVVLVALGSAPDIAQAHSTNCSYDGLDTVALHIGNGKSGALRIGPGNAIQFSVNPSITNIDAALWAPCGAAVDANTDFIEVSGHEGAETFVPVDACTLCARDLGDNATDVDLGGGTDSVHIAVGGGNDNKLVIELGRATDGTLIGNLDRDELGTAPRTSDIEFFDIETFAATGGSGIDEVVLDGDFRATDIDGDGNTDSLGTAPEDPSPIWAGAKGNFDAPFTFNGGSGFDIFAPGDGDDTFNAGAGEENIVFYDEAPAAVRIDLEAGAALGGSGRDTLNDVRLVIGSIYADTLLGSSLDNKLAGSFGDDFVDGRAGDDWLQGDGGNDTIYMGAEPNGADHVMGDFLPRVGSDTLDYGDRISDVYIAPGGGGVSGSGACPLSPTCEGDEIFNDFENFISGSGNDVFVGGAADETFQGGAGNDTMEGSSGGDDSFDFSDSDAAVTVDVSAGTATGNGSDTFDADVAVFIGSEQADTFIDDSTTDSEYRGKGGNDLFDQGASPSSDKDAFSGGRGIDTLDYSLRSLAVNVNLNPGTCNGETTECDEVLNSGLENLFGGSGTDRLVGNLWANLIMGGDGADLASGNNENDQLIGGNGRDRLSGGAQNDRLGGGSGNDRLIGGPGFDTGHGGLGMDICDTEVTILC